MFESENEAHCRIFVFWGFFAFIVAVVQNIEERVPVNSGGVQQPVKMGRNILSQRGWFGKILSHQATVQWF